MKRLLLAVMCTVFLQALAVPAWAGWSTPAVWPQNTKAEDRMPWVYGNTLYYVGAKYDLYQSTWDGKEWSTPMLVPGKVNSPQNELQPCVVKGGTVMYFMRMTTTGTNYDVFRSEWDAAAKEWGEPVVVTELSTSLQDWDIWVDENETEAYVVTVGTFGDGASVGLRDVWHSKRLDGVWSTPLNVGMPVNSEKDEWDVFVDKAGRIYVSSNREGTMGDFDIFVADSLQGPISNVTDVNSTATERAMFVSDQWLVFSAIKRPDSVGGYDLWFSIPTP